MIGDAAVDQTEHERSQGTTIVSRAWVNHVAERKDYCVPGKCRLSFISRAGHLNGQMYR